MNSGIELYFGVICLIEMTISFDGNSGGTIDENRNFYFKREMMNFESKRSTKYT